MRLEDAFSTVMGYGKPKCWVCSDEICKGWGCGGEGLPCLPPGELKVSPPRLCTHCEQEPAMLGEGSNYCEGCREALRPQKYRAIPSERQLSEREALDNQDFELTNRAGGDWRGKP
jgi:hypothetical protein